MAIYVPGTARANQRLPLHRSGRRCYARPVVSRIIVCQHVAYEILGTLNPLLKNAGLRLRYVNFEREPTAQPSLDGYDGLVVLGGPMNVDQTGEFPCLATETALVTEAIRRDMPVLGICLGAQIIAKALGAGVRPNGQKEIGWYPVSVTAEGRSDPLLGSFDTTEQIFQWHGDTFDIPKGAVRLASSPACENQAFRFGDRVYGFQFHLEVDEAMIARWLEVPHHVDEIVAAGGLIDPAVIREQTPLNIERLEALSRSSFGAFVALFGTRTRSQLLGSG